MSPITVGAHWHNIAQRTYPEPAVSVEHVYIDDPSTWPEYMERCRVLLENGWRVVLKCKWRRGQDTPPTLLAGVHYLAGLADLLDKWADVLNSPRAILTMGNEPNWQEPGGALPVPPATVAALFNGPAGRGASWRRCGTSATPLKCGCRRLARSRPIARRTCS